MTDKTQPRDWSDICKQLNMIALQCTAKLTPFDCPKFYKEALAILQEFDAQNQPNVSDNGASGECVRNKPTDDLPKEPGFLGSDGGFVRFYDCTSSAGIKFSGDESVGWVINTLLIIGNDYEYKIKNELIKKWRIGKLVDFTEKHAVVKGEDGNFRVLQRNCTEIRKHTPKPLEHTFTREEIEQVLNAQQLQDPNAGNLCVRGKIIRQLLKELGENV